MAASVASIRDGFLLRDFRQQDIERQRIGTRDEFRIQHQLELRIAALSRIWEALNGYDASSGSFAEFERLSKSSPVIRQQDKPKTVELFKRIGSAQLVAGSSDAHDGSVNEGFIDYSTTERLAKVRLTNHTTIKREDKLYHDRIHISNDSDFPDETHVVVDLSQIEGIRSFAGKKDKQAAKKAQQAKWADSGDEGNGADRADAGEDGAGGGGNDGGSGAGGDPPDGNGGGEDPDAWFTGASKKNKVSIRNLTLK